MAAITAIYAVILSFFYIGLSVMVIKYRAKNKIRIGDNNNPLMLARIRSHANFIEYTPLFLILLMLAELNLANPTLLHAFGLAFLFGRIIHSYGLIVRETKQKPKLLFRQIGMVLTFITIALLAISLVIILQLNSLIFTN